MANRREFLLGAATLSIAGIPAMPSAATTGTIVPRHVLVDERYAESLAFADAADRLEFPLARARGDFTDFWYRELDRQWRTQPFSIAGLTTRSALFVLEQLSRPYGLRTSFKVEHGHESTGTMIHALAVPASMMSHLVPELTRTKDWPASMARAVSLCPVATAPLVSCAVSARANSTLNNPLVSWVIAPKRGYEATGRTLEGVV